MSAAAAFAFRSRRATCYGARAMIATSQPLAAQAGLATLAAGGTAADAAVTAAAMHAVVEPMMAGVGGDCFALYFDAASGTVTAMNASGRAPAAACVEELHAAGLRCIPESDPRAVSVPGAVAGWEALLARHGRTRLSAALAPAIEAAERGYPVSEVVAWLWQTAVPTLLRDLHTPQPSAAELLPGGRAPRAGERVRLPELAATLRAIADGGAAVVYRGELGRRMAEYVQAHGGWLAASDLCAHTCTWDTPIHSRYRGVDVYQCPPNGQGLAALLALDIAAGFDFGTLPDTDRTHLAIECMRLAFADAQRWVADPRAVALPLAELLDPSYAAARRALIDPRHAAAEIGPGDPRAGGDTAYVAVVDAEGNACSLIHSVFRPFGTGLVVPGTGVCLQNRAALFSLEPDHPNVLAPGKRPYQTIIPALSLYAEGTHAGALHACFGVVGGQMQPQGQLQVLINLLDLGMAPQPALDALRWQLTAIAPGQGMQPPGAAQPGGRVRVEEGFDDEVLAELARRGHHLELVRGFERVSFGGAQLIVRDPDTGVLAGASDPRLDGCAIGL